MRSIKLSDVVTVLRSLSSLTVKKLAARSACVFPDTIAVMVRDELV
jgi:hypothetical protein